MNVDSLCGDYVLRRTKQLSIHIWHDKDGFVFHDSKRLIKFSETFEILVAATFSGRWHWHCNLGKWHYALEYYYNYEKKYFGYMHYINAFMMDKMVDKLMCSIALKNIFKLHSMALFFIYWNILRVPCSFANYHCRLRRHCWSWHRAQKHDKV